MRSTKWTPLLLFVVLTFFGLQLSAQEFLITNDTITTCDGLFYDSGGPSGNYGIDEDFAFTICPDGSSGTHIQLVFSGTDIGTGDIIQFYDGASVDPDTRFMSEFLPGSPFIIQATAVNPTGCVTITFSSNGANEGAGWSADINCTVACQTIQAALVMTDPPVMPADTGYIDICPGDRISLSGMGIYPQDGEVYNHSDLTSSFEWDFGDGTSAVGPNVTKVYEEPGGYFIQLTITDTLGCQNTNFLTQRVRVSPPPSFLAGGMLDEEICAGDTVTLVGVVNASDPNSLVSVIPNEGTFPAGGVRSDSLPLPDGTGAIYETSIAFTEFSPGQTLNNIDDLLSICVTMEHSWLFDLDVSILCPNGTEVILQSQEFIANEVFLGIPFEGDDFMTPDPPGQGVGWEYCWTPNATNGNWTQYVNANNPGTLPTGDYSAFGDLTDLLGCPLNGEWTIIVQDQWGSDNGWIFEWSINFDPSIFPTIETFTPPIIDYTWEDNPSIVYFSQDSIVATPVNAGTSSYIFSVTNEFGCEFDTSINVMVLPDTHPDCYDCRENINPAPDDIICEGESSLIDVSNNVQTENTITFESYPSYPFGAANHPPSNPYANTIEVNSVSPLTLTDPTTQLESVCIDIATDWNSDLAIFLRAPNGAEIPLSTGNGGGSDNYTNTCFSPTATTPITGGTGPFTGTFSPEGNFGDLVGTDINGPWSIIVSDQFGPNDVGEFISWSISFSSTNEITYTWSPADGLSCTDCPNPTATPATTTEYILTAEDSYGCVSMDTILVGVVSDIPAPDVVCRPTGDGILNFTWDPVGAFTEYEINVIINGVATDWFGPITQTDYDATGLVDDDEVTVQVRVYLPGIPADCPLGIGSATCVYDVCELEITAFSITDINCFGANNGIVVTTLENGDGPYTYFLDEVATTNTDGIFNDLTPGPHIIGVMDAEMCRDTINIFIAEPDEVIVNAQINTAINCFNADNGTLIASAVGGDGNFTYTWSTDPTNPTQDITDVAAGTYTVTATDGQNCVGTTSIDITQPDSLEVSVSFTNPVCFGSTDGSASASATGGTGNYTYAWSSGTATAELVQELGAGEICVSVTDENGCETVACELLTAPETIVVDEITFTPVDCNGFNTGTASVTISGGNEPYTYLWNDGLGQTTPTATSLLAGTYEVVATDANGCQTSAQIEVTEPDTITIAPTIADVNCTGDATGSISLNVAGGVGDYTFEWNTQDNAASIEDLTAGIYNLTVTDENSCVFEADYTITEPAAALQVSLMQTLEGCFGNAGSEVSATATGGTGEYTYLWEDGQDEFLAIGLDSVEISLQVTDENGCLAEASITPSDLEPLMVNVIPNFPTCFGLSDGRLGVNDIMGGAGTLLEDYDFEWDNGQTGPIATNLVGDRSYVLMVSDNQGCETMISTFLPQPDPITFNTGSTDVLCFEEATGTASITNIQGSNPGYTVTWDANANSQVGETATDLATGSYSATIVDAEGCEANTEVLVAQPTDLQIELEGTNNLCFGESNGQIAAVAVGGVGGYSFSWSNGVESSKVAGLTAGNYEVTLTDANGCELVDAIELIDPALIQGALKPSEVSCNGGRDGRIEVDVQGGTPPYRFSTDNDFYVGSSILIGLNAGVYNVFVQDDNGCIFIEQTEIMEPPSFVVDAGDDIELTLGDTVQLDANATNAQGEVTFIWSAPYFGTLSCNECPDPTVNSQNTISYELYGVDSLGCEATDRLAVFIQKPRVVVVPTGFTPNDDRVNDRLLVHGLAGTQITKFQVFNRWGELVYEDGGFEVNTETVG
ncbi:MAG: proprotein convertase P-domain-containing protein, partial [Bacteroidota bacterium]